MILVVGSTGLLGSEIVDQLVRSGEQVRAMAWTGDDPAVVEKVRNLGAGVVLGDLRDPDSLRAACAGISAVITTASSVPFCYRPGENTPKITDEDGALSLVDVAGKSGVDHFVYISFPVAPAKFPLQDAKRAVEGALPGSGMSYSILRPTFFPEVWLSPEVGFDYANRKAAIYGTGNQLISWISYRDAARFTVAALTNAAAHNVILPLGGPEKLSPLDVVKLFERVGGRPFEVTYVPAEALQQQLAASDDPMAQSFSGLMLGYANGSPIDMGETLRAFPFRLATVEEYARSVLETPAALAGAGPS